MGSGKRDFSEFTAKLEKHLERLPDYTQRAQEKLQKYWSPAEGDGHKSSPSVRDAAPQGPARRSSAPIPVVAQARTTWVRWNDPAAKLARRKRRTSRALSLWVALTVLCGLYGYLVFSGLIGTTAGDIQRTIMPAIGVALFGTLGVRSGLRLYQLKRVKLQPGGAPPSLPAASSAAREPMERLAEAEASLAELIRQLVKPTALGMSSVTEASVADAQLTATDAAAALRGLADRVQAIERARNASPAAEWAALDGAVQTLREQLDDGVDSYCQLVAAAGRAVGASGGLGGSKRALTDATDHLAGLAMALRELS